MNVKSVIAGCIITVGLLAGCVAPQTAERKAKPVKPETSSIMVIRTGPTTYVAATPLYACDTAKPAATQPVECLKKDS